MTTLKSECRKFSPNIFNKSKCQNCFRTKDAHSAEALESNRATRKVSKCGYLFVAPDWDFSVSINRTKRWQRRWFVLYDDGELTYSVDEHPDTVPQAVIDMNKVLEVSDAQEVTGNQFAIAVTAPEKVHFVKGTSREESKWWFDVLVRIPRNTIRGKHKRNATFPGGKATTTPVDIIPDHEPSDKDGPSESVSRPRFLSTCEPRNRRDWNWLQIDPNDEDVFPTKDNSNNPNYDENSSPESQLTTDQRNSRLSTDVDVNNALNKLITSTVSLNNSNNNNGRTVLQTKLQDNKSTENEVINNEDESKESKEKKENSDTPETVKKGRSRRYLKRENRGSRSQRSRSDGVAKMIPGKDSLVDEILSGSKAFHHNPVYLLLSDTANSSLLSKKMEDVIKPNGALSPVPTRRRHTSDKDSFLKYRSVIEGKSETHLPSRPLKKSESLMNIASESAAEMRNRLSELKRNHSYKGSPALYYRDRQTDTYHQSSKMTSAFINAIRPVRDTDPKLNNQNDVDKGSGSTVANPSWESGVDICTEDMFLKKGWLMRQTLSKEWSRHWFVLKNSSLTYYRDPSAEDCGILDGVLDLNQVTSIEEFDSDKKFAFCLIMWDNKKHVLSAVTAGIRGSWIQAIQHASDLWDLASRKDFSKDEIVLPEHSFHSTDGKVNDKCQNQISASSSPVPSPEAEKLLDLSSSDDQSEYFSIIDDDDDGGEGSSSPRALPPSPPVTRTPMSLVKERARTRSNSYSQPTRQSSFSSGTDCSEPRIEQHSDGTNSDHSSTCAQDSPLWQRKKYYQDICAKLMENQFQLDSNTKNSQFLKESLTSSIHKDSSKSCKDEINGNYQMKILQERCKDLENQLAIKEKEVEDKTLELDAFGILKSTYHSLIEQHKSLKKQITEGKEAVVASHNELSDSYQLKYELLKAKYIQDRTEWENKVKKEKLSGSRENNCEGFVKILQKTKQTLNELKDKFRESEGNCDDKSIGWKEIHQLCEEIEKVSPSLERKLKRENEIKKLRKALCELQLLCNKKQQKLEEVQGNYASLNLEVEKRDLKIQELQLQLQTSNEDCLSSLLTKPPSQEDFTVTSNDSVEDLPDAETDLGDHCQQLKSKFDLAREQIRKLKKEVKESHANYDDLEIVCFKLKQELKVKHENHQSQIALMTARVDDLTSKFTLSERNFRQLKQKMMKVESKQERRRSSLKNKEVLTLSKECEAKLFELERKIFTIENELKEEKQPSGNDEPPSIPADSQIEGDDNSLSSERHLQKRLSQDSTNGSENTGLLLRLHTLGVRVKSASETVEKQADGSANEDSSLEKPKICLQVRTDEEENSVQEEGGEDWSTLSYATSLADLQAIDGLDGEFPCSWSECLECLDQKVESLLLWVKTAVQLVQKQEASAVGNTKGCYAVNKDAISLASDVIESLDNLPTAKMEETIGAMSKFDTIKLCYKMLLLNEAGRILQKIMSSESKITLEKFSVSDIAFKVINEHLYQVTAWGNCEDKSHSDINSCVSLVEKLISMCSIDFDSFQSESEDFAQSSQQPPDRLLLVQEHCTQLTKLLDTARESRFSTLWHMLTDVPVQDADVINQNSSSLNDALQEMDPLLSNLIVMVNQVFETTERELCAPQYQNLSLLQCEHESWNSWCLHTCKILKLEQQLLVDELKKLCPRVNEGNLFSSGFNDAVYQKIVFTVSELAQIVMSRTITQSILSFIVDHRNNVYSDSYKQWISHLHENYYRKALLLAQGEIFAQNFNKFSDNATLKNILNLGAREIKISEEIEAVHHLHQRNLETLQTEMESLCEENKRLISKNCLKCEEVTLEFHRFKEEIKQKSKEQNCCQQCFTYKTQLQSVTEKHEVEMFSLHKQYKEKIDELHKHLQLVLQQKDEIHLQEVQKLEEDLQFAHKRLNHLEIEYDEQIQSLRELYEQKMSLKQDPINEESVRRRYQMEIDQLKGLCEKGLIAMENSHRRITLELEKRHKQELTILEAEKEKVLAEETQATLTALEVMRKAHADELQREIARFKEEFAKKMQSDYQSETFYQKHGSELEEIKREILSISEKYSVKCLERASLEERVEVLCHQLQETNHQLFDLMARNKQLKVHLAMDIAQKKDAVEGKEDSQFAEDLKLLLKLKESELAENREENAQLKQELHLAQMHVSVLDVQCEQLDQSLKAERRLREDEVSSLRTKLDAIISASSVVGEESLQSTDRSYRGSNMSSRRGFLYRSPSLNLPGHLLEIASRRILTTPSSTKELLRSPSCPGLQNPAPS